MSVVKAGNPIHWRLFFSLRYLVTVFSNSLAGLISRIAMASLVIAVSLLILVLSVMNGFEKELENRILTFIPHVSLDLSAMGDDTEMLNTMVQQLSSEPSIKAVIPYTRQMVLLKNGLQAYPLILVGLDESHVIADPAFRELLPAEKWADFFSGPANILLSSGVSRELQPSPGQHLLALTYDEKTAIKASSPEILDFVFSGSFHTGTELDKAMAFIPLQTKAANQGFNYYRLELQDLYQADDMALKLSLQYPGAKLTSWTDTHGSLYQAIRVSRDMVAMLLFLVIAIAVFNVVTTLMLMTREASASIAILKTMGAGRTDIALVFLYLGGGIGLIGTFIGCVLGLALASLVSPLVQQVEVILGYSFLDSRVYPVDFLPSEILLGDVLLISAVAVVMSIAGAILPAWRASAIAPAKVLKYE